MTASVSTQNGWASMVKDRVEISALDDKSSCLLRHNRLKPIVRAETPTIFVHIDSVWKRSGLVCRLLSLTRIQPPGRMPLPHLDELGESVRILLAQSIASLGPVKEESLCRGERLSGRPWAISSLR